MYFLSSFHHSCLLSFFPPSLPPVGQDHSHPAVCPFIFLSILSSFIPYFIPLPLPFLSFLLFSLLHDWTTPIQPSDYLFIHPLFKPFIHAPICLSSQPVSHTFTSLLFLFYSSFILPLFLSFFFFQPPNTSLHPVIYRY